AEGTATGKLEETVGGFARGRRMDAGGGLASPGRCGAPHSTRLAPATRPVPSEGGFLMEPRKVERRGPKPPAARGKEPRPRLRIVKLEERIAPNRALTHSETVVREPAKVKSKAAEPRSGKPKRRFRVVRLEERITPGITLGNHNETLVRDPAKARPTPKNRPEKKRRFRVVKLEERVAPKIAINHNETLVRVPG